MCDPKAAALEGLSVPWMMAFPLMQRENCFSLFSLA